MKINFTKENELELRNLIADSVLLGEIYSGPIGQTYTVFDLVVSLTIGSLRALSKHIQNKINELSNTDEWVENPNTDKINVLENKKRIISLIIGWRLYQQELNEINKERERLTKQLNELVESQKTPSDLIAELQQKIKEL